MIMTYEQILADIKKRVFYPIYLLMGEEPFFIDTIKKYILIVGTNILFLK